MAEIDYLSQIGHSSEESYTEGEASIIRSLMAENDALIDAIDVELADLLIKRNKHLDYARRGKIALAPFKKLPLEIVRDVFLHASWSTIEIPFPIGESARRRRLMPTQVVLAQVCSAWRRIAFSIPRLWNVVSIGRMKDHTRTIASELLSRARGSAITLTGHQPFSSKTLDALIMPNQFKSLQIMLSPEQVPQFQQLFSEACANLESLSLHMSQRREIFVTVNPDKYPRLKYLSLDAFNGFINLQTSVIPWHQLTTLKLYTVHSSQLDVLRQCTPLTNLEIQVKWVGINNVGEICLRRLLNFVLWTSAHVLPSLLRIFNFPNLEKFKANNLIHPFTDIKELMLQHFNFRRLRVLDISELRMIDNIDIRAILSCASCLESLSLPGLMITDENTMNQIAEGRLGPSVRCIDFTGDKRTWDQILEFVETRLESAKASQNFGSSRKIVPFESVQFLITDPPTPEHLRRLTRCGTVIEFE